MQGEYEILRGYEWEVGQETAGYHDMQGEYEIPRGYEWKGGI